MIKSDRIIGIFLLLLSGGLLFSIITMQYPQFDRDPGPAFVPILYMVGLTICAIALIFIPKKPKGNAESEEVNNDEQQEET